MQHARDRIKFMTMRARLAASNEQVVQEVNMFLRGWAGHFRYGKLAHAFDKIRKYAELRVPLFIAKRHKRARAWGFAGSSSLSMVDLVGVDLVWVVRRVVARVEGRGLHDR